jgi:hypothetical protein
MMRPAAGRRFPVPRGAAIAPGGRAGIFGAGAQAGRVTVGPPQAGRLPIGKGHDG